MATSGPMTDHALRTYRRKVGLTQEALAASLGVKKSAVSRWEAGQRSPNLTIIKRIREITGGAVSADDFMPVEAAE